MIERVTALVVVTVEHEAGPIADPDAVLTEVARQVHGLGPIVLDYPGGAVSVYSVVDAMAEPA